MALRLLKQSIVIVFIAAAGIGTLGLAFTKLAGLKTLSVQSGSMAPAINKGDLITVKSVPEYKVGDVITYINPSNKKQTITHRISSEKTDEMGTRYITKGDANTTSDNPINHDLVVGKVTHSVPYAGYGADFIRNPLGLLLIIYIPAFIVMWAEIKKLSAYYKTQAKYEVPGGHALSFRPPKQRALMLVKLLPLLLLVPAGISVKAYAALQSTATLTNNSISTAPASEEPPNTGGDNNTTVSCESNNNVNVNTTTNQTATSGDASSSGNTTGGDTTSGDATNSSTNNTNITVTAVVC